MTIRTQVPRKRKCPASRSWRGTALYQLDAILRAGHAVISV